MKLWDIVTTAFGNALRSKARTLLTVIAIFIGAFTLTLTSGLGVGINQYVDKTVQGYGQPDMIYVIKMQEQQNTAGGSSGPQEYDPSAGESMGGGPSGGMNALTDKDLETIRGIDGVTDVQPILMVRPEYIGVPDGKKYSVGSLGFPTDTRAYQYAAGGAPDDSQRQITVPTTWLEALGHETAQQAVGQQVTIGVRSATGQEKEFTAEISGVTEQMASGQGGSPTPSQQLSRDLYDHQRSGMVQDAPQSYAQAVATVPDQGQQDQVKQDLAEKKLTGMTVDDLIGAIRGIITTVTWVLNGFALIALLAASFGIVNTLLMAVQERTREIGLMKALGMPGGRIFALFSAEAVVIGAIGSVIGVAAGVLVGTLTNGWLTGEGGALAGVTGLTLYGIDPLQLLLIVLLIMVIAFLAGTIPAARAARKDPIEALRYE